MGQLNVLRLYLAGMVWNREDFEKENVCLVFERLVLARLMVLKGSTDTRQYFYFILYI